VNVNYLSPSLYRMFIFFAFLVYLTTAASNSGACPLPTRYRSATEMKQLLPLQHNYNGAVTALANYYVNLASAPGPADWFKAAQLQGLSTQQYDNALGTYNGTFYLQLGPNLVPISQWVFNLDYTSRNTDYNTYCGVTEASLGLQRADQTGDNLFVNTYTKTKAVAGPGKNGYAIGSEYFYFPTSDSSHNCLTNINVTTGLQTTMICFFYKKVQTEDDSMKRSITQGGLINGMPVAPFPNDPFISVVGRLRIPKSAIPAASQSNFVWQANPDYVR
jgi:hypothetical protein